MQLVKFDPFQEFDKLWNNNWALVPNQLESSSLDLYEEDGKLIAEVSIPGYKKEEISISTAGGVLEIKAQHQESKEQKTKRRYILRESSQHYLRRVPLPEGVSHDKADAVYKKGVLKVSMPLTPNQKPKEINVK